MRPSLIAITCYSDAAGSKFTMLNGERRNNNVEGDRGAACVVLGKYLEPTSWSRVRWPKFFLEQARDEKGSFFGSKTTTLEVIGMLLPFLSSPKDLMGKHVIFRIDNIAVFYGWENKIVKNDVTATILIRAIHLLAFYLGIYVHVEHVPRCSDKFSTLADHLSRTSTTGVKDLEVLENSVKKPIEGSLNSWLEDPKEDWELPKILLNETIKKL